MRYLARYRFQMRRKPRLEQVQGKPGKNVNILGVEGGFLKRKFVEEMEPCQSFLTDLFRFRETAGDLLDHAFSGVGEGLAHGWLSQSWLVCKKVWVFGGTSRRRLPFPSR